MARNGQPTSFGEHLFDGMDDYLKPYLDYVDDLDNEHAPTGIPTVAGLSLRIGVAKNTVYGWKKMEAVEGDSVRTDENISYFSGLIDRLEQLQEVYAANRGLTGDYNASIAKLVMARHGYVEKVDNVSSDGSMSPAKNFNDFYDEDK